MPDKRHVAVAIPDLNEFDGLAIGKVARTNDDLAFGNDVWNPNELTYKRSQRHKAEQYQ